MRFYHLIHPDYFDDYEFERQNPFDILHEFSVPGIACDACGELWFNVASRLPVDLPNESLLWDELKKPNLKLSDHNLLRVQFEKETGIQIEPSVFPGARFGKLSFKIRKPITSKFLWCWEPGTVFVTEEIATVLQSEKVTGCLFYPVKVAKAEAEIPDIFELVVIGEAGYAAKKSNISVINRCESCGRIEYSKISNGIHVDQVNWDGTDICKIKEYPTYVLVSEKVKQVLDSSDFTNFILIPTGDIT
jgi:hypothetical protein